MAGWSFIYNAERLVEVFFWYLIIIMLFVITGMNAYETMMHYLSRPTGTYVLAVASTDNLTISNFTLKISMGMLEFSKQSIVNRQEKDEENNSGPGKQPSQFEKDEFVTQHYACLAANPPRNYLDQLFSDITDQWAGMSSAPSKEIDAKLAAFNSKANEEEFKSWKTDIDDQGDELLKFFLSNRDVPMPEDYNETDQSYATILNNILEDREAQLPFWLMNLEQYNDGDDWLEKMAHIFRLDDEQLPNRQEDQTGTELLSQVLTELAKIIYIDVSDNVQVYLRDWKYEDEFGQKFTFEVIVPSDANIETLDLNVYSFLASWYERQMEILYRLMPKIDDEGDYDEDVNEMCQIKQGAEPFFFLLENSALATLLEYYEANSWLTLDTHRGNVLEMAPRTISHVDLMPTSRFISETNKCYPSSFQTCIDQCLNYEHLKKCDCYQWNLYYLNLDSGKKICDKPCETIDKKKCQYFCEDQLSRPCDLPLYYIEYTWNDIPMQPEFENLTPLYTIKVSKPSAFNHPKFVETYTYTLATFMSEIGGLLNFWMGINLIGVVHLGVYLVKQCLYATKPGTKTRMTILRICGARGQVTDKKTKPEIVEEPGQKPEPTIQMTSQNMINDHELAKKIAEEREQMRKEHSEEMAKMKKEIRKLAAKVSSLDKKLEGGEK